MSLRGFQFAVPRSDILVWLDAADRSTLDIGAASAITGWRDKGPAGRHANSISGSGVSYVASGINGRPAIQFTTSGLVRGPLVYNGSAAHGFIVFRVNPLTGHNSRLFSMGTLNVNDYDNNTSVILLSTLSSQSSFVTNRGNNATVVTPISTGLNYVAEGSTTTADTFQSINGNSTQQGLGGYSFPNLTIGIYSIGGATNDSELPGSRLDGFIGEIIVFSRRLSAAGSGAGGGWGTGGTGGSGVFIINLL